MTELSTCLSCIASPRRYSQEQWFALALSVVCMGVDGWSIYRTAPIMSQLPPVAWITETALAVAVVGLVWFAFTKNPGGRVATPRGDRMS